MKTVFTWDPAKAERNKRAHGISFEQAKEVFADPFIVAQEDISDESERRWHGIGMTGKVVLLLVVFVERVGEGAEIIRIISARKANQYEESIYEDQFS
jgi:uncharacterized protein